MLDLSFFGWFAIGIITCGLGMFFAIGYHEIVYAMFYKKMAECEENTVSEQEQSSSDTFQKQFWSIAQKPKYYKHFFLHRTLIFFAKTITEKHCSLWLVKKITTRLQNCS